MNRICSQALLPALLVFCSPVVAQQAAAPADTERRQILVDRIDTYKKTDGIVVGIITPQGTRVVSYGRFDNGDKRVPSGDSVFEIGSASKVFTSLLLSDMVQRGEVKFDDPVASYLPKSVHVPTRNGKEITLLDLAWGPVFHWTSGRFAAPNRRHGQRFGTARASGARSWKPAEAGTRLSICENNTFRMRSRIKYTRSEYSRARIYETPVVAGSTSLDCHAQRVGRGTQAFSGRLCFRCGSATT